MANLYNLRIPFELPNGVIFSATRSTATYFGFPAEVQCLETRGYNPIALTLKNVPEDGLSEVYRMAVTSFVWAGVKMGFSIRSSSKKIVFSNDAVAQSSDAIAYKSENKTAVVEMHSYFDKSFGLQDVVDRAHEIHKIASANHLSDERLYVALRLYGSVDFDNSEEARFILLMAVLESLTEQGARDSLSIDTVCEIEEFFQNKLRNEQNEDTKKSLTALLRGVGNMKSNSIAFSISLMVDKTLRSFGESLAKESSIFVAKMYNHRSKLLHKGKSLPLDILPRFRGIVEGVLLARLQNGVVQDQAASG